MTNLQAVECRDEHSLFSRIQSKAAWARNWAIQMQANAFLGWKDLSKYCYYQMYADSRKFSNSKNNKMKYLQLSSDVTEYMDQRRR
jgi:TRAP-type mannitol/chloroaromatic compound transport system substrate-binding protein